MFYSVSCAGATSCTAVGAKESESTDGLTLSGTLIEQWNGTTWSVIASPNPAAGLGVLNGVSCISARHCFAVGYAGRARTLVERL